MRQSTDFLSALVQSMDPESEPRRRDPSERLPLSIRISGRLADILIALSEVQADLQSDAGAALRWLQADVDRVADEIDALLRRLAS